MMRLAYWYPASTFSAWSISLGAVDALRRMGHEVLDCGVDPASKSLNPADFPKPRNLSDLDGIIVSGPEHLAQSIRSLYPEWDHIGVPKAAWLHETVHREDYGQLDLEIVRRLAHIVFCPAIQDEVYGFEFLPFGVDTAVFHPSPTVHREIDVCFIGLMYPKRQQYLEHIKPHLADLTLKLDNVEVREGGKVHHRKTVLAYADRLRRIKVLLNLPALSQLLVTKIYEAAASGACVVTPIVKGAGNRNHDFLGKNICLYDQDEPAAIATIVAELLRNDKRQIVSDRLAEEMYIEHRIELRLQKIVAALKNAGIRC